MDKCVTHGEERRELVQADRAGAGRRGKAGQAQRAVELAETLGCTISRFRGRTSERQRAAEKAFTFTKNSSRSR
jgi:hypothetical protein